MKFRVVLAEQLMLMENVAQAEKVLKQLNIPLDNPDYLRIKNRVVGDNSTGFLGLVIKLAGKWAENAKAVTDSGAGMIIVRDDVILKMAEKLYDEIKEHREDLQFLPQNINNYDNITSLREDLKNIPKNKIAKKFANLVPNKDVKDEILRDGIQEYSDYQRLVTYFNEVHGTPTGKLFLKKINRYNTLTKLLDYLTVILEFHRLGISYESILSKAKSRSDLQVVYNQDERVILLVSSYEALREVGSPSWCIYDSKDQFNNYTDYGRHNQYVFYDFSGNFTDINYTMIGFTMNGEAITASHLMDDGHIQSVFQYLNSIGVYPKIRTINKELEGIRKNKGILNDAYKELDGLEYTADMSDYSHLVRKLLSTVFVNIDDIDLYLIDDLYTYAYKKLNENLVPFLMKNINYTLDSINNINSSIARLTNLITISQKFPYPKFSRGEEGEQVLDIRYINLVNKDFFDNLKATDTTINAMKKIFVSYPNFETETYNAFIKYLISVIGRDEELFGLIRLRKTKHGEEFSDVEFFNIKNTGNFAHKIMSKLQQARRGMNVELTKQEVKYGIENGLKKSLADYYSRLLPWFSENQVEFDDAEIYKQLGLLPQLKKIIQDKYNMMGGDQNPYSINSIERSVLDIG